MAATVGVFNICGVCVAHGENHKGLVRRCQEKEIFYLGVEKAKVHSKNTDNLSWKKNSIHVFFAKEGRSFDDD